MKSLIYHQPPQRRSLGLLLLALIFFCFSQVKAQPIDSSFLIYKKQFTELTVTRSGTLSEAGIALEKFNTNQIHSNESFAIFLKRIYPQHKGLAVVMYFYINDSLKRVFFEPGKLIEEKSIAISRQQLLDMGDQLSAGLGLYKAAEKKAPLERGTELLKKPKQPADLNVLIKKLTSILLPPAFNESFRHLVVIPALNIGSLPFHVLKPYKDDSYFIDKCSFTIAPTLVDFVGLRYEALFQIRRDGFDPTMSSKSFDEMLADENIYDTDSLFMTVDNALFVGNPEYPTNGKYFFPNLPGAEEEISNAAQYSKHYKLLTGKDAVKDTVIKYLDGTDVAYFATHGISSSVDADDNSFLVLSGTDPYLTSLEIKDLRLNPKFKMPDLVVLSACQTGLGKPMEAGMMGSLSRAFLLAGSNHVIMSLWNVDDKATAFLMNRFIFHLQQPHPFTPAVPLQLAIIETKARFPEASKWASFSLFGVNY